MHLWKQTGIIGQKVSKYKRQVLDTRIAKMNIIGENFARPTLMWKSMYFRQNHKYQPAGMKFRTTN